MAKRESSLQQRNRSSHSHKTKKRLEIKKEMLAAKASKGFNKKS